MEQFLNLVQMTATYSNAVLVAILPHFTDVAKKLELPFSTPIVQAQVRYFFCDPRVGEVGGYMVLTNGYEFWFRHGYVNGMSSPWNVFRLQDPDLLPKFYGPLRMDETEAVALARKTLKKLGYTNEVFNAVEPEVQLESPKESFATNQGVPQYRIIWHDPDSHYSPPLDIAELDVNANVKHVDGFQLYSKIFWRTNLDVGVTPKLLPKPKPEAFLIGGRRLTPVSAAYSNACMNTLMPIFTDFAAKLNLPMSLPITREQCTNVECWLDKGEPSVQIILTNGARFNFNHGYVFAFYAGDNFYWGDSWGQPVVKPEDLYWPQPVSTNEMIQLARDAIRKLGYDKKLPEVENQPSTVFAMQDSGTNHFTRYQVGWDPVDIPGMSGWKVSVEVDAKTKSIKSIYLDSTNLWRGPPKIDVPEEMK
jgi:hypothetical protein